MSRLTPDECADQLNNSIPFPKPNFSEVDELAFHAKMVDFIEFVSAVLRHPGVDLLPAQWGEEPTNSPVESNPL